MHRQHLVDQHSQARRTCFFLTELEDQGVFSAVNDVSFNRYTAERINALCNATDMTRIDGEEAELLHLKSEMRWREFLIKAVEYKRNIIISGKTGSGKTTFARSLTQVIPTHERVVTIEDVHELKLMTTQIGSTCCMAPHRAGSLPKMRWPRACACQWIAFCWRSCAGTRHGTT